MNTSFKWPKFRLRWLKSTWAIVIGMTAGVIIGVRDHTTAANISMFGDIYLTFLKMCVIPIMITAIVPSLGRLLSSHYISQYLKRMLIVFGILLVLVSALGLTAGLLGQPGSGLSSEARETLGQTLVDSENGSANAVSGAEPSGIGGFLLMVIPGLPVHR